MVYHSLNNAYIGFRLFAVILLLPVFLFFSFEVSAQIGELVVDKYNEAGKNSSSDDNFFSSKVKNKPYNNKPLAIKNQAYFEQRISDLESSVWQLRNRYNNLRRSLRNSPSNSNFTDSTDMFIRFTQMEEMIRQLVGKNQLLEHDMGLLNNKIEQLLISPQYRISTPARKSQEGQEAQEGYDSNITSMNLLPEEEKGGIGYLLDKYNNTSPSMVSRRMIEPKPDELYQLFSSHIEENLYADAQDLANNFVKLFPKHKNASKTLYAMGEVYFKQKDYKKAASNYLRVYVDYGDNKEAPQSIYKLGLSLMELKEKSQGCAALYAIKKKYPNIRDELQKQISSDLKRYDC